MCNHNILNFIVLLKVYKIKCKKKPIPPLKEYLNFHCEFFFYCEFSEI